MNIELFKKKLQIVGWLSVEEGRVNFGKLYKEGFLSVNELEIYDDMSFPYKGWEESVEVHEQRKLDFLKINWQDDKDTTGFCLNNAWSTYKGCTGADLKWSEEKGYEITVRVNNGDNYDGGFRNKRFNVTFKIEKFAPFNKAWGSSVSRQMTRDAQQVRNRQIAIEEAAKVLAIEEIMLNELGAK